MNKRLITNNALRGLLYKEAVRRGETRLPYSPFTIYLDPCNACDLRCTFCPQSNWGKRARGQMQWELFEKALEEIVKLKPDKLFLFCYGEATLNKNIIDMVNFATKSGLWVRVHTNAFSMSEEKANGLIRAGLNECVFSFDTADKDLYNRMRRQSDFDHVLSNIQRMIELRHKLGAKTPIFRLQELVPCEEGGRKATNTQSYRDLFRGYDVRFTSRFMHSFAGQGSEKLFPLVKREGVSHCNQLYRRIVVNFDGKIHACCLDPEGYNIVADLTKGDSIAEAWNSPRMVQLRQRTNQGDVADLLPCKDCEILYRPAKPMDSQVKRMVSSVFWDWINRFRFLYD